MRRTLIKFPRFQIQINRYINQGLILQCIEQIEWEEINKAVEQLLIQDEIKYIIIGAAKKEDVELIGIEQKELNNFFKEFPNKVTNGTFFDKIMDCFYTKIPAKKLYVACLYYPNHLYVANFQVFNYFDHCQRLGLSRHSKKLFIQNYNRVRIKATRKSVYKLLKVRTVLPKDLSLAPRILSEPAKIKKRNMRPAAGNKAKKVGARRKN